MQPADSTQDIFETAARWQAEGKGVALASVVNTWGSSPRPIGSYLVADDSGHFQGSVSGGCVEGAVIGEARAAIKDHKPRLLSFGITNEQAWEVGLACGGKVEIFVAALDGGQPSVTSVLDALRDKQPIALVIDLASGAQAMVGENGATGALALSEVGARRRDNRARRRTQRHNRGRRPALLHQCAEPAAPPGGGRRRAYRPAARADGGHGGLRRDRDRSAQLVRQRRALSRRPAGRRMARRGAGRVRARPAQRRGHPDP